MYRENFFKNFLSTLLAFAIVAVISIVLIDKGESRIPEVTDHVQVPGQFRNYNFIDISNAGLARNWYIEKFYHSFKNHQTYGFYDSGPGLDNDLSFYWFTEKGKAMLLFKDDEGFLRPEHLNLCSLDKLTFFYWSENEVIQKGPEIFDDRNLMLTEEIYIKLPAFK